MNKSKIYRTRFIKKKAIMKNDALKALLDLAKSEGVVSSNETTKQNIYQSKYFEGVVNDRDEKKIRRTLRNLAISFLSLVADAKDKNSFETNYKKFEKFYKDTYVSKDIDFSVFEGFRKESAQKVVAAAKKNIEKYSKK